MSKVTDVLDRYYFAFIDQQRDWDFFLGLADYVRFVYERPEIKDIIGATSVDADKLIGAIEDQEKKATKELRAAKEELLSRIKAQKLKFDALDKAIAELELSESNASKQGRYISSQIEEGYRDVIKVLLENNHIDFVKSILPGVSGKDLAWGTFALKVFPELALRQAMQYNFQQKKESEIWGIVRKLKEVMLVIFEPDETLRHLKENNHSTEHFEDLVREMKVIKNDGQEEYSIFSGLGMAGAKREFSSSTDSRINTLKKNDYKLHAVRFNNYILKELGKRELDGDTKKDFSYDDGKLKFRGQEVVVAKSKNTNPYYLLQALLENPEKVWDYDELWAKMFQTPYPKGKWRKIYNAAYDLNEKVAKQTPVDDFIDVTKTTVRIRPKYL